MFLQSMRGIIEQLDGERFEPVILCSQAIVKTLQTKIRREGLRFVPFGDSLPEAIKQVREAACDLIYYWEVGSDAMNYFLPFARLAPVQCTGWGSTITSGVPAVDYFLSSELVESPGSRIAVYRAAVAVADAFSLSGARCRPLRPRFAATSACPRAGICTSAFKTR